MILKDVLTKTIHPTEYLDNLEIDTVDCESTPYPEGQGEVLPASDRETCPKGREGLVTQAGVAGT